MKASFGLALAFGVLSVHASQKLPSFPASGRHPTALLQDPNAWWFQLGNTVYHKPQNANRTSGGLGPAPASLLGVEEHDLNNIKDYYYAVGSKKAISDKLKDRLVASEGLYHVFHIPEVTAGKISLQTVMSSTVSHKVTHTARSESISQPVQLAHAMIMGSRFADYKTVRGAQLDTYVSPVAADVEQPVAALITKDLVMGYLRQLVEFKNDDGLISRAFDDVSASNNAVAKLKAWFTSMNAFIVCEHKFGRDGARSNVVAFLKGESADAVIVGAHYDSRPFHSEHMPAPGAVDNGSGSAGVLAIAKAFAEAGVKPKNSIYFVLFGGEEAGLLGSDAFVNDLKANKDVCTGASFLQQDAQQLSGGGLTLNRARARGASRRLSAGPIYAAIIMDEVGWKTPRAETYPCLTVNLETFTWSEDIADHLYEASILYNSGQDPHPGCENGLDVIHSTNPFGSDHMSFLSAGIHAVLTIHGDDDYFSSYGYHSSNDKIELIDEPLIANIVRMNGVGALRLGFVDLLPSSLS